MTASSWHYAVITKSCRTN